jgi:tetratricopeptide (TPR) repeat protein
VRKKIEIVLILIFLFSFIGCTTGGGDLIGALNSDKSYEESLLDAWALFNSGEYDKSLVAFNEVRRNTTNDFERDEARLGIGWSYLKLGDFENAEEYFSKVENGSQELFLGRASLYILKNDKDDYKKAYLALKSANLDDISDPLNLFTPIRITRSYVYALAGIIYYFNGDMFNAKIQFTALKENPDYEFDYRIKRIYDALVSDIGL